MAHSLSLVQNIDTLETVNENIRREFLFTEYSNYKDMYIEVNLCKILPKEFINLNNIKRITLYLKSILFSK